MCLYTRGNLNPPAKPEQARPPPCLIIQGALTENSITWRILSTAPCTPVTCERGEEEGQERRPLERKEDTALALRGVFALNRRWMNYLTTAYNTWGAACRATKLSLSCRRIIERVSSATFSSLDILRGFFSEDVCSWWFEPKQALISIILRTPPPTVLQQLLWFQPI